MMLLHILSLSFILFEMSFCQEIDVETLISTIFKQPTDFRESDSFVPTMAPILNHIEKKAIKLCGIGKECVAHYLCKDGKVNRDGRGVIDVRFGGTEEEEECHYLEVCCDVENELSHETKKTFECGYRNVNGVGFRITNDDSDDANNSTLFGEFPWMVNLIRLDDFEMIFYCGGSLISTNVVLTAAHCVQSRDNHILRVRAGEWDTLTVSEILPHQDRQVINKIVHPKFNKHSLHNDVALLYVDSPFELADNVRPICLPPADINLDFSRCYATGLGKDLFGKKGNYQTLLKKLNLPIVARDQCEKQLRATRLGKLFKLDESFICAGGEIGIDTCTGDGGSPLVCPYPNCPNRFYQAGIVAFGIGCGSMDVPGVYANVPFLRSWIDEQLKLWNVDPMYYTA